MENWIKKYVEWMRIVLDRNALFFFYFIETWILPFKFCSMWIALHSKYLQDFFAKEK